MIFVEAFCRREWGLLLEIYHDNGGRELNKRWATIYEGDVLKSYYQHWQHKCLKNMTNESVFSFDNGDWIV